MANPFDPRTVLLAKHAQHVVLVHFPIALFLTGFLFDVAAGWKRNPSWETAAFYNVCLAGVAAVPTVLSGLLAWRWELEGRRLHGILLMHLSFAVAATALMMLSGWLHWTGRRRPERKGRSLRVAVEFAAVMLVMATAHLGGFLSGVNSTF